LIKGISLPLLQVHSITKHYIQKNLHQGKRTLGLVAASDSTATMYSLRPEYCASLEADDVDADADTFAGCRGGEATPADVDVDADEEEEAEDARAGEDDGKVEGEGVEGAERLHTPSLRPFSPPLRFLLPNASTETPPVKAAVPITDCPTLPFEPC